MNPPDSHLDLLDRPLFAHLATVASSGAPLVNPMWFLWDRELGVIKMTHTNHRHNYRYLQREPRVALSITDPGNEYRYLQVRGVVETIDPDPTGGFFQVLQHRYRGVVTEVADRDARVIVSIRPTGFFAR
ncbi:MAG TPA: PPOX class F420-dependent oxidoreductase [Candidatus Dormibacteraeota bacterium]